MSDSKIREAFEKWATENEYSTKMYDSFHDDYYDDTTQSAWRAWQAAQSEQSAELERLRKCEALLKEARDDVAQELQCMRTSFRDSPRNKGLIARQQALLESIDAAIAYSKNEA